jgi:transposase-like protein
MPRAYPAEFRARAVSLIRAGQSVRKTASDLDVSCAILHRWVKQDEIDRGEIPGVPIAESRELRKARKRIREARKRGREGLPRVWLTVSFCFLSTII